MHPVIFGGFVEEAAVTSLSESGRRDAPADRVHGRQRGYLTVVEMSGWPNGTNALTSPPARADELQVFDEGLLFFLGDRADAGRKGIVGGL